MRRRDFLALASGLGLVGLDGRRASSAVIVYPERLIWPAVALDHVEPSRASGRSHYGGRPLLPANFDWPHHGGRQLDFLLELDLAALKGLVTGLDLPTTGRLLFFYDVVTQPWGFDPAHAGSARVIHLDDDLPGMTSDHALTSPIPHRAIGFRQISTVPSPWSIWVDDLRPTAKDRFDTDEVLVWSLRSDAHVGGHPAPIQGADMEMECESASAGISVGDGKPSPFPEFARKWLGKNWRLLLQLPSDDALGTLWGDDGILYFWIRETDLAARDFSKVWLILQCF